MEREEVDMNALGIYLQNTLPQQCSDACVARMCLEPDNTKRMTINIEFTRGYQHAVRVISAALNLLDISGASHIDSRQIDPRQIQAFKEGLENYLSGSKREFKK